MRWICSLLILVTASLQGEEITFPPTAKVISKNQGCFPKEMIEKEPDLLAADLDYALANGGPITQYYLTKFLESSYLKDAYSGILPGLHVIVDTRIHALKKGEYPGISGWHTDFIERVSPTNMELDYSKFNPSVKIYIVNFSDHPKGVSNTEYLTSEVRLALPEKQVYTSIDRQINAMTALNALQVSDGEILAMDQYSLHRVRPAHQEGLRGFIRIAVLHNLASTIFQDRPQNATRKQIQSYLEVDLKNNSQNQLLGHSYAAAMQPIFCDETAEIQRVLSISEINDEPMLVNCSLEYALQAGGPITRKFIKAIHKLIDKEELCKVKVNTRMHMLMKDQYSDIPLFPDLPLWRSGAPFEEILHPGGKGKHFLLLLSTHENGVSEIEFCRGPHHCETEKWGDKKIMYFENGTLSRSLPAHNSGWRLSLLITIDSNPVENKIVRQTRVYTPSI